MLPPDEYARRYRQGSYAVSDVIMSQAMSPFAKLLWSIRRHRSAHIVQKCPFALIYRRHNSRPTGYLDLIDICGLYGYRLPVGPTGLTTSRTSLGSGRQVRSMIGPTLAPCKRPLTVQSAYCRFSSTQVMSATPMSSPTRVKI